MSVFGSAMLASQAIKKPTIPSLKRVLNRTRRLLMFLGVLNAMKSGNRIEFITMITE